MVAGVTVTDVGAAAADGGGVLYRIGALTLTTLQFHEIRKQWTLDRGQHLNLVKSN